MALIPFADNFADRSTEAGFQFTFYFIATSVRRVTKHNLLNLRLTVREGCQV